jgi:hypothetical protein
MKNPYEPPEDKSRNLKWWLLLVVAALLTWLVIEMGSEAV